MLKLMLTKLNNSRMIFPAVLMGLALFCLLLFYYVGHPVFKLFIFNSDALYLNTLFQDILNNHGHIKDWHLTPAPYFFPDYLIFLSTYIFAHTVPMQTVTYAILQMTLLTLLLYFFFENITKYRNALTSTVLTSIVLLWLTVNTSRSFTFLLMSAFHTGTFLIEIAGLILFLHFLSSKTLKQQIHLMMILSILSFITTCSDILFFVQLVIPACLAHLITQRLFQKKILPQDMLTILPIIFGLMGFFLYPLFVTHPTRYSNHLGFKHFQSNLQELLNIIYDIFIHAPITTTYILIFYIFTGLICVFFVLNKQYRAHRKKLIYMLFLIQISAWASISPMLFITHFTPTERYLIPTFTWPVIIGILFLSCGLKRYFYPFALTCMMGLLLSFCIQIVSLSKKNGFNVEYYPPDIACIDLTLNNYPSLHHGIAQYWDAKFIQNYSRHSLTLAQYDRNLTPHVWITSEAFYQPTYDFAIIANHADLAFILSRKKLKQYNERPLETIHCGGHDLLIYGQGKLKIKN